MALHLFSFLQRDSEARSASPRARASAKTDPRTPPTRKADSVDRLNRLSRGVLVGTFVSVAAVGFGITSTVSATMQVEKMTGNTKPAVIATKTIEAGTPITQESISVVQVPNTYLSSNASSDLSSLVGKIASVTIAANTQICSSLVADLGNTSSLAARIPTGYQAVTVNVTSSTGLSTLLRCGDRVRVLATTKDGTLHSIASTATVLALDGALLGSPTSSSYSTVTLQVTSTEAEEVISAEQEGTIVLVLNPLSETS